MITLVLYGAFVSSAIHFFFSLAFLVGSRPSSGVGAAPTDLKYTIVFVLLGALLLVVDCSLCRVFVICAQKLCSKVQPPNVQNASHTLQSVPLNANVMTCTSDL